MINQIITMLVVSYYVIGCDQLQNTIKKKSNAVVFTDDNFESEVLESDILVLVDFWAKWCGPCKMIAPIIDELAEKYEGKVKIGKLNVDENKDISSNYDIRGIPALLIFKGGTVVDGIVGAATEETIKKLIEKYI